MPTLADQAFEQSLDVEIRECDIRLRELKDRVERMLTNSQVEHYRKIEALRSREKAIHEKVKNLSRLDSAPVQELRAAIQIEVDSLKRSIELALEDYK